jgi:hypothetical protein
MGEREEHPGGCLCGAVRYVAHGQLRDVLVCHCVDCLRFHGGPGHYTALAKADLELVEQGGLRWREAPMSDAGAERGFCGECGSSLFWDARGETVSISAGTLDGPTGLRIAGHWYLAQAGDYYPPPDDDLPHHRLAGDTS